MPENPGRKAGVFGSVFAAVCLNNTVKTLPFFSLLGAVMTWPRYTHGYVAHIQTKQALAGVPSASPLLHCLALSRC